LLTARAVYGITGQPVEEIPLKDAISRQELLRMIPPVDKLLERDDIAVLLQHHSRGMVLKAVQKHLAGLRHTIVTAQDWQLEQLTGRIAAIQPDDIERELERFATPLLQRVINATGVILHTNLGRAVLADEAIKHVETVARFYSNLEYDVHKGGRGSRYEHVQELLCELTGAEAALVVNNNAAAVLLALNTLANGREAIVSRGEIVEIGGSFRIPDIMSRSGTQMVEVGTTNKTHISDYEKAISGKSAVIVKVHTSNYRILGFTAQVDLTSLVALAGKYQLPVIHDAGSGNLIDLSDFGLAHDPTVREDVQTGADLITFSGDKLLGGPQAGMVVGKKQVVEQLIKNPLNRALRIDKLTLAALESTLRLYRDREAVFRRVPTLRMITTTAAAIEMRAGALIARIRPKLPQHIRLMLADDVSQIGGGALPLQNLPTKVIAVSSPSLSVEEAERRMRSHDPPVITRIQRELLLIDLRAVGEDEEELLADALIRCYVP
jgi:L-seryl-tRNA(Ser) seleniumtransferase